MTHTPGPWKVCNFDKSVSCTIDSVNGVVVAEPSGPEGSWGSVKEEHEANAHLIAAAPELLEACKTALGSMQRYGIKQGSREEKEVFVIEQAIAKAEGR